MSIRQYRPQIRPETRYINLEAPRLHIPNGGVKASIGEDGITPTLMRHDAIFQTHFDGGVVGISDVTTEVWETKNFDAGEIA